MYGKRGQPLGDFSSGYGAPYPEIVVK